MPLSKYQGQNNIVAQRVRQAREEAGLTQDQLVARLQVMEVNIDQQSLSRIEHNLRIVRDFELLCLAKALKKDPNWFLQDEAGNMP